MPKERWKPVVGYEGVYSVSSMGLVRREISRTCGKAGAILKQPLRNGYPMVNLSKDGVATCLSVHILVMVAFRGPCPEGMNTNHRNGKKADPRLSNLEYGTQSHNVKEAYRLGLRDCRGEGNGKSILTAKQVRAIRKSYSGLRGQQAALGRKYGVSSAAIRGVVSGKNWQHI